MNKELRAGEMTWRAFKEQMGMKGVNNDTVVKFLHLRTQEPADMTVFALGTSEEKCESFEFAKSDEKNVIELESRIRYLTEDLDRLRQEKIEDKYNIRVLKDQLQTLVDLLCGCQDRLFKAVSRIEIECDEVEIPEERESIEITVKKHPRHLLRDVKRMVLDNGFKYAGIKHVDENTVEMKFEKKD